MWIVRVITVLSRNRANLRTWAFNAGDTLVKFWQNWIREPAMGIWRTLRNEDTQLGLGAELNAAVLTEDVAAFERMLAEYTQNDLTIQ